MSCSALAQDLEVVDSKRLSITVGTSEHSMLDIYDRKVQHIDVDHRYCEIANDRSQKVGKLIFKPVTDKPFTMFVTDNHNDIYIIKVQGDSKKEADLFTIKNVKAEERKKHIKSAEFKYQQSTVKTIDLAGGHEKAILDLTRAMALNDQPRNADVTKVSNEIKLWKEATIFEKSHYSIGNLKGVKYLLKNISDKPMILAEPEFYPLNKKTLSVAIEHHELQPEESTFIYIVKSK